MHVVSIFPSLFNYSLFAPLILRAAVGIFLCLIAFDVIRNKPTNVTPAATYTTMPAPEVALKVKPNPNSIYGYIAFVLGILLIIGLATQAAALATIILLLINSIFRGRLLVASDTSSEAFIFVIVICLSLLLLGAGTPAIDLPL